MQLSPHICQIIIQYTNYKQIINFILSQNLQSTPMTYNATPSYQHLPPHIIITSAHLYSHILPSTINPIKLLHLHLTQSTLTLIDLSQIQSCTYLKTLSIHGKIQNFSTISNFHYLRTITCTNITTADTNPSHNITTNLKRVIINKTKDQIIPHILFNIPNSNIQYIHINDSSAILHPNSFTTTNIPKLKSLTLQCTKISFPLPSTIRTLKLMYTHHTLTQLPNLNTLYLIHSCINLPLPSLPKLKRIHIRSTYMTHTYNFLQNSPLLTTIYSNAYFDLNFSSSHHLNLHTLCLTHSSLRHLDPHINTIPSLKILNISHCEDDECITLPPSLEYLNMSYCKFNSLYELSKCPKLTTLYAHHCPNLQDIDEIRFCENLTYLNLQSCYELCDIYYIRICQKLTHINLAFCESIKDFSPLKDLTALKSIQITRIYTLNSVDDL